VLRGVFKLFGLRHAIDTKVSSDNAKNVVDSGVDAQIGPHAIKIRFHLRLQLLVGPRLQKKRAQLRTGLDPDPLLAASYD
jgi:hypothetical protein